MTPNDLIIKRLNRIKKSFNNLPFNKKLEELTKDELDDVITIIFNLDYPLTFQKGLSFSKSDDLRTMIKNCGLFDGFKRNFYQKRLESILKHALRVVFIEESKRAPKDKIRNKQQYKKVVDELFMLYGDDEKQIRKTHKRKQQPKVKASQLKKLFDEEAAQLHDEADKFSQLADFLYNEFGDKDVTSYDLERLFDETKYKPKYDEYYNVHTIFDEYEAPTESIIDVPISNIEAIFFREPKDLVKFEEAYRTGIAQFKNNESFIQNDVLHIEESPINEVDDKNLYDQITDDKNNNNQHVIEQEYYIVKSVDHLKEIVANFIDESTLPFKLNFVPYFVIEETLENDEDVKYTAVHFDHNADISLTKDLLVTDAHSIHTVFNRILEVINDKSNQDVRRSHSYPGTGICCYAISLIRYKLVETGAEDKYNELSIYDEKRFKCYGFRPAIYKDNLCMFRALSWHHVDEGVIKKSNSDTITYHAKVLYKQFYNKEYTDDYKGFQWTTEIERFCKTFNVNINTYKFNPKNETFKTISSQCTDYDLGEKSTYMNVVSHILKSNNEHIMSVKSIHAIQGLIFCEKCKLASYKNNQKGHKLLKKHMEICDGSFTKVLLQTKSLPYVPIYFSNKLYTFCKAHGYNYTPMKYYGCYDFETFESVCKRGQEETIKDDLKPDAKSEIISYLHEFSVALAIKTPDGIETEYFCYYDYDAESNKLTKNNRFVEQFIQRCIYWTEHIRRWNIANFKANMGLNSESMLALESNKYFKEYLDKWARKASIFGFNSEKFDTQFLRKHLDEIAIKNLSVLGDVSSIKQLMITNDELKTDLVYRDVLNYISKCSLDEASQSYGMAGNRVKGFFPYAMLNKDNLMEILLVKPENEQHIESVFPQSAFYNDLKQEAMSDDDYKCFKTEFMKYKNFYDYTKFYNEQDIKIMFPIVDNVIDRYASDNEDMLQNLSLSGLASSIKYLKCYDDFDVNKSYKNEDVADKDRYKLTSKAWQKMIDRYTWQDNLKKRECTLTNDDYEHFAKLIDNGECWSCHCKFSWNNRPTLDRINNEFGHSESNVRLACNYCNAYCSDLDAEMQQFYIQLKRFSEINCLTNSISDPAVIQKLFDVIAGGLSTVHHRVNKTNKNYITKLFYHSELHAVEIIQTLNKISHFIGVDFNSLYPSAFSGVYHDANPYTGGKMYMPGKVTSFMENTAEHPWTEAQKKRVYSIIHNKDRKSKDPAKIEKIELFVAEVAGYIPPENLNKCINFLPIFRNVDVPLREEVIGNFMCDYMDKNEIGRSNDKSYDVRRTLTQLFSTIDYNKDLNLESFNDAKPIPRCAEEYVELAKNNTNYMGFSSYYLWFLIDEFGFKVTDVKSIITFNKHLRFGNFVNHCMNERQKAICREQELKAELKLTTDPVKTEDLECAIRAAKVINLYYKNLMNSSYGYDGKRCDQYNKTAIVDGEKAIREHRNPFHIQTVLLGNNRFLCTKKTKNYKITTPVQCAVFTLDNAKFWYLNFIYKFMVKCLDMSKLHFVEGDTDSQYWGVAGDLNDDYKQGFKHVIVNEKFYNKNVHKWLPYDFYTTDGRSPLDEDATPMEKTAHEKKLLGCAIEKQGLNIVALGPKCYTTWNNDDEYKCKVKGVSLRTNKHITYKSYVEVIDKETTINGTNYLLQYKKIICKDGKDHKKVDANLTKIEQQRFLGDLNAIRKHIQKQIKAYSKEIGVPKIEVKLKSLKHELKLIKYKLRNPTSIYVKGKVYKFARIKLTKTALTGCHVKMRVNNDQCQTCTPLFIGVADDDVLNCLKEPINSVYNKGRHNNKNVPQFYGVNSIINPNRKNKKNWPNNVNDYVFPTRDYAKNPGKIYDEPLHTPINNWYIRSKSGKYIPNPSITGIAIDVNKSPFCVIDFDIKVPVEKRDEVIDYIKRKYGLVNGLVQTTSKGLHYYTRGSDDETFEQYTRVSRHIKAFREIDANGNPIFEVDVMICNRDVGQSIIMGAGSQAKNSAGVIGEYTKIGYWTFNDLESFSSFETRFRAINNTWLVKPVSKVIQSKPVHVNKETGHFDEEQTPN